MPDADIHPTPQQLAAFGLGKLPEPAIAAIAAHLESCAACRHAVTHESTDYFLAKVRDAGQDASSFPPALARPDKAPSSADQGAQTTPYCPNLPPELAQHPKYRILRELGRGGMGVVYQARTTGMMDRQVVIKVISRSLIDQPAALERFLREVHAAAQLSHPNIVTAYDAEKAGDLHMLVMEFVPGQSLAEVLAKQGPLPVAKACHYMRQVAWALQHAHERGMVHRDIKPQNLMLTPKGQVKVLDFGLAKVVSERDRGKRLTASDAYMGTPEYSAPEQATDARSADIRADLYSLGCTLYCLLAGRPPFREDTAMKTILAHLQQAPKPLLELRPEVPERLWHVVARLLAKEPGQRYQKPLEVVQALTPFVRSAAKGDAKSGSAPVVASPEKGTEIAADTRQIKKVLREVPEKAPPMKVRVKGREALLETRVERSALPREAKGARESRKQVPAEWSRRWPILVGVGILLLALLGMWASGVLKGKTPDGILIVEVNEPNPEVFIDGEKATMSWANGGKKAEIRVKLGTRKVEVKKDGFTVYGEEVEIEEGKRMVLTAKLVHQPIVSPVEEAKQPIAPSAEQKAERANPPPRPAPTSDYDLTGGHRFAHFGKDGARVVLRFNAAKQKQHFARVYDLTTGQPLTPPLKHDKIVYHASFSPDGKRVVTASVDNTARVWDAATGKEVTPPLQHDKSVYHASFSPDGKRIATASGNKTAQVWAVATGRKVTPPLKHNDAVPYASFSPEGQRVVSASWGKTARLWDATTGREITTLLHPKLRVCHASFSPDGKRVSTAGWDNTARLWDAATGKEVTPPLQHEASVLHASFSPDGQRVVTASWDNTARLWDAATGKEVTSLLRHEGHVLHASFSPDGKRVVTASWDKTARLWDAATGKEVTPPLQHEDHVLHASFSPDGKRVVTASKDNMARLWDAESGEELKRVTIAPPPAPKPQVTFRAEASIDDLRRAALPINPSDR
jgi:WD40 repeat protein/serine/threonine protein kinase